MYKIYYDYREWKDEIIGNGRKFWIFDIPTSKFVYYIFTPKEIVR